MKWIRLFLLLFLIPCMIYASSKDKCQKNQNKAKAAWEKHNELCEQFKRLGPNEKESGIHLLDNAIVCCKQAIDYFNEILHSIKHKSSSGRNKHWRIEMKSECEQNINVLNNEISNLQNALNITLRDIDNTRSNIAFEKANVLYQESEKKAALANARSLGCPRPINNLDVVVSTLYEIARLYEEASSTAREALALISSYSDENGKAALKQSMEVYQQAANKYNKEAAEWPSVVAAQKATLRDRLATLKEDRKLFEENGLKRSSYEVQKQILPILEQFVENGLDNEEEAFSEEISQLKIAIACFEDEADKNRLTESVCLLLPEEYRAREIQRRELFFKSDWALNPDVFLHNFLQNESRPFAIPLDGQAGKKRNDFNLFTEQFYRFLVESDVPVSHLLIKVFEKGEIVHEEKIDLPIKNTMGWDRYLTTDGMIFIPETKLKAEFGIDLRLNFVCDPKCIFSMIIAQKGSYSNYQFSVSLDEGIPLYECNLSEPPPWQLGALRKPPLADASRPVGPSSSYTPYLDQNESGKELAHLEYIHFPVLDQLVEELKSDPLLLAQFVFHEIALVDPFLRMENGVFQAPQILRNPYMTYLERQGSPWEQCQLLIYLLRKAGYQADYVMGDHCSLPKAFVEKMLLVSLPEEQKEALLRYPWVLFCDGNETVSLFPWMKEMQIMEGYDLYNFIPEEYASANRWILHYLKGDEKILQHIGPDGDDTAAVLFFRFVEEELRKQRLSSADIGIHRTQLKKQFVTWKDFPRPSIQGNHQIFDDLGKIPELFASARIEISSHENPHKNLQPILLRFASYDGSILPIYFSATGELSHCLHIGEGPESLLNLDQTDHHINIKISFGFLETKTFSISKGTAAALCFHFGGVTPQVTSLFYEKFANAKEEQKKISALLAFIGAAYFEKCGRGERIFADLHKITPPTVCTFGLAKLAPDLSKGPVKGPPELQFPQVDMFRLCSDPSSNFSSSTWNQEIHTAYTQWSSLTNVDLSSNEHQILREIFNDPNAISTVKLLQLAHIEQQKKGLPEEGFLVFTSSSFELAEKNPEIAQSLHFFHLKDLILRDVKATSPGEWDTLKNLLGTETPLSDWGYAYVTPGLTSSLDGTYKEMGALIFHPHSQYALISSNNLLLNGGLGSPVPNNYFTPFGISQLQLTPSEYSYLNSYTLQVSPQLAQSSPGIEKLVSDVRLEHKSFINTVADPVDVVSGAFYVDEIDLSLSGPFSLEIRRNYSSQNPLYSDLGYGWKLSLNPFLIEQDGKLYATEADGTTIVYSFNQVTSRWEVFPEDNPDLYNFNQKGIGSTANPFHAYIENDILYGPEGSKRFFEDGLLKKWTNAKGNTLTFSYREKRLSRIESSNGDFCGFHYNHEDRISEIYAKDGRRISYDYNSRGDLVKVVLPNSAIISYEYDKSHRLFRETRPHGRVLENIYDGQGRVGEQRSPMGPQQEMIISATFDYQDGTTVVTDAKDGKTTYKIFGKQIYKITDPLGYQTLQSWFIDKNSWFDPETESVINENQPEGWPRSLKSTTDKRGLTTYYLYDTNGNPHEIGLKGQDLTGNGVSLIAKKLTFNAQNLCFREEILDQKTITTYDPNFPYLPKRIEKFSGNTLVSCVELEYNASGQIEKEDHSGAITLWNYNTRGFPDRKSQVTGTEDPDVVTEYAYNHQGQCIKITNADGIQDNDYDIMGNQIQSLSLSPSGALLSATYIGYNLNNEPIWKQTANAQNVLYLDYHASGLLKATRQTLSPSDAIAYTLYEYDRRGYLIEEVDPLGYCTYRDYDALGKVKCETKHGHSTLFSYEPGGLIENITSPSGAKTTCNYTTNGLLKEEIYPDDTTSSIIYDFFGRPIRETKNDIAWDIEYDDPNHRVIRTHLATKDTEIQEFDPRGNLIRFTDAAGYTLEKTYDGLGRPKTETSPKGEQTTWSYQSDTIICALPSGERTINRFEAGRLADSEVFDATNNLIARTSFYNDPETEVQQVIQGEQITTTWMNALGLPIAVQKGELTVSHQYDACGQCIISTDGEGKITLQTFDPLGRLIQKELPDGGLIKYGYDRDSNLDECQLPNQVSWVASYDSMGRKRFEELRANGQTSQHWTFDYKNGYLTEITDPMQRLHTYLYDLHGRLAQENVDEWCLTYTYDPRGLLSTAEQQGGPNEHSFIERSYDPDGHLILESIYLNSILLQQTIQDWTPYSRSLQIDNHQRDLVYQNNQLVQVSTQNADLSYTYDLSGALKSKNNPLSSTAIDYNTSSLPKNILTHLPQGPYEESLEWYPSGKLFLYGAPGQQQKFTYNSRGYLQFAGQEKYEFDFGAIGTGVRTAASNSYITEDGLDIFSKILTEIHDKNPLTVTHNPMGQVTTHNQRLFGWDPWGRLLSVTDAAFTWEASYDALGRRLQTRYTPGKSPTFTTTSLYDPEEEFQEIGIKYGNKTFWKIYGPNSCDALTDETSDSVFLVHNALDHLTAVVSQKDTFYTKQSPSSYGPQNSATPLTPDLFSFAQSLTWHSKSQDPTGLIWMGARYYDPKGGRFLSPDPVGHPICLDLYTYANGDPINYFDPDGRFFSPVYQPIKATFLDVIHSPRFQGGCQMVGGAAEMGAGGGIAYGSGGIAAPIGFFVFAHGADNFYTGLRRLITGRYSNAATSQLLQKAGMPTEWASFTNDLMSTVFTIGGAAVFRSSQLAAFPNHFSPFNRMVSFNGELLQATEGSTSSMSARLLKNRLIAQEISGGHAFEKHILNQGEFSGWIRTRNQLSQHIETVLNNPTAIKELRNNRAAYWYQKTGTVVIRNPSAIDGGTVFQPKKGYEYFLKDLK